MKSYPNKGQKQSLIELKRTEKESLDSTFKGISAQSYQDKRDSSQSALKKNLITVSQQNGLKVDIQKAINRRSQSQGKR